MTTAAAAFKIAVVNNNARGAFAESTAIAVIPSRPDPDNSGVGKQHIS